MKVETAFLWVESFYASIPAWFMLGLRDLLVLVVLLIVGRRLSRASERILRSRDFDQLWEIPWKAKPRIATDERKNLYSKLYAGMVGVSCGLAALWILTVWHGRQIDQMILASVLKWMWIVGLLLAAWVWTSHALASAAIALIGESTPLRRSIDTFSENTVKRSLGESLMPALGVGIYSFVFLFVLMFLSDMMAWAHLSSSLSTLYNLVLRVMAAFLVLLTGWVGLKWVTPKQENAVSAIDLTVENHALLQDNAAPSSSAHLERYFQLAIVLLAMLVSFMILAGSVGAYFIEISILLLAIAVVLAFWRDMPDIRAGLQLFFLDIQEISLEGTEARLAKRGLIISKWIINNEIILRRNSEMLKIYDQGESERLAKAMKQLELESVAEPDDGFTKNL